MTIVLDLKKVRAAGTEPELVTIPGVEILSTGTYSLSTGTTTFTEDDLVAAKEAMEDPTVPTPRLKLGHLSEWGDAEPAFGKVENPRLSANGQTLLADYVGVPRWLAEIMPSAYPSRSIEGAFGIEAPSGRKYSLVLSAVALLGVVFPGVGSLEDLAAAYTESPEGLEVLSAGVAVSASVGKEGESSVGKIKDALDKLRKSPQASVDVDDVRRIYYEEELDSSQVWWWIRAIQLDPNQLIVDDDEGGLYRVPFEIDGDDVNFSEPIAVEIVYVDQGEVAAASEAVGSGRVAASFDSRSDSRPETNDEEDQMDPKEIRSRLGLPEDASDDDVLSAIDAAKAASDDEPGSGGEPSGEETETEETEEGQPAAETETEGVAASNGTQMVDAETLASLQRDAAAGREAREQQRTEERDRFLQAAVSDGKFPPARLKHWQDQYDRDPEGTRAAIEEFPKGLVPVDEKGGAGESQEAAASYEQSWLSPGERARIKAAQSGESANGTRVVQEGV